MNRRSFMKTLAALGAAAGIPAQAVASVPVEAAAAAAASPPTGAFLQSIALTREMDIIDFTTIGSEEIHSVPGVERLTLTLLGEPGLFPWPGDVLDKNWFKGVNLREDLLALMPSDQKFRVIAAETQTRMPDELITCVLYLSEVD